MCGGVGTDVDGDEEELTSRDRGRILVAMEGGRRWSDSVAMRSGKRQRMRRG